MPPKMPPKRKVPPFRAANCALFVPANPSPCRSSGGRHEVPGRGRRGNGYARWLDGLIPCVPTCVLRTSTTHRVGLRHLRGVVSGNATQPRGSSVVERTLNGRWSGACPGDSPSQLVGQPVLHWRMDQHQGELRKFRSSRPGRYHSSNCRAIRSVASVSVATSDLATGAHSSPSSAYRSEVGANVRFCQVGQPGAYLGLVRAWRQRMLRSCCAGHAVRPPFMGCFRKSGFRPGLVVARHVFTLPTIVARALHCVAFDTASRFRHASAGANTSNCSQGVRTGCSHLAAL